MRVAVLCGFVLWSFTRDKDRKSWVATALVVVPFLVTCGLYTSIRDKLLAHIAPSFCDDACLLNMWPCRQHAQQSKAGVGRSVHPNPLGRHYYELHKTLYSDIYCDVCAMAMVCGSSWCPFHIRLFTPSFRLQARPCCYHGATEWRWLIPVNALRGIHLSATRSCKRGE